ncbi:hypothetical protein ACJX0J_035303, partial [Zea mays]
VFSPIFFIIKMVYEEMSPRLYKGNDKIIGNVTFIEKQNLNRMSPIDQNR